VLGDQVGERVQLLGMRERPLAAVRREVGRDVEPFCLPRIDALEIGIDPVRAVHVPLQIPELEIDPAIAHPVHRRDVEHLVAPAPRDRA
jgi:hypothetical protein